jgi:hypothetical protein
VSNLFFNVDIVNFERALEVMNISRAALMVDAQKPRQKIQNRFAGLRREFQKDLLSKFIVSAKDLLVSG